jgi:hypothetical protein
MLRTRVDLYGVDLWMLRTVVDLYPKGSVDAEDRLSDRSFTVMTVMTVILLSIDYDSPK